MTSEPAVKTGPGGTTVELHSPEFSVFVFPDGETRLTFEGFGNGVTVEVYLDADEAESLMEELTGAP